MKIKFAFLALAAVAASGAWCGSADTLVIDTDTVVTAANQSEKLPNNPYHNATISADFTLDGAFLTNGWSGATVTVGNADRIVKIAVTNAAGPAWMLYLSANVNVGGCGATFCLHGTSAPNIGWIKYPQDEALISLLGGNDCYIGNSGTFGRDSTFTVNLDTLPEDGVLDFARLLTNGYLGAQVIDNATAGLTLRLLFDGGCTVSCYNSPSKTQFNLSADNSAIKLESVNGNLIWVRQLHGTLKFTNADGSNKRLITAGNGDFLIGPGNSTPGTCNLEGVVTWGHNGDNYLNGTTVYTFKRDNFFPYGEGAGDLYVMTYYHRYQLGSVGSAGKHMVVDLNGTTQRVNSFLNFHDNPWSNVRYDEITNRNSSARATLEVGEYPEVSELCGRFGGTIDIRKKGSGKTEIKRATTFVGDVVLYLDAGTTYVTTPISVGKLVIAAGAKIVADNVLVACGAIENQGTIETVGSGRVCVNHSDNSVLWMENRTPVTGIYRFSAGTLALNGDTCTNEYWRFVLKAIQTGYYDGRATYDPPELTRFVLLDTTERVTSNAYPTAHALTSGMTFTDPVKMCGTAPSGSNMFTNYCVTTATAAKDLEPGQISLATNVWWALGVNGRRWASPATLFAANLDNNVFNPLHYDRYDSQATQIALDSTKPDTWIEVSFRLKAGMNKAKAYSFAEGSYNSYGYTPYAIALDTSADGVNWVTVDDRSGLEVRKMFVYDSSSQRVHTTIWYDDGHPLAFNKDIPHLIGAVGFASTANIEIDAGATLDARSVRDADGNPARAELSNLSVDMAAGVGTFRSVKFASGGRLHLLGAAAKVPRSFETAITLDDCDTSDISSWKLSYNSVEVPATSPVSIENGKLVVNVHYGTVLLVR